MGCILICFSYSKLGFDSTVNQCHSPVLFLNAPKVSQQKFYKMGILFLAMLAVKKKL